MLSSRLVLGAVVCLVAACSEVLLQAAAEKPLLVQTDRTNAVYRQGETVVFKIKASPGAEIPPGTEFSWKISKDGVAPVRTGTVKLSGGEAVLRAQLDEPGFLLCQVNANLEGKAIAAAAGAAVDPLLIKPSMPVPEDFDEFWSEQRRKLEAVPMNVRLTAAPEKNPGVEAFDAEIDCLGAPVSGYYARPRNAKPKSLPIVLSLHGAGVRSSSLEGAVDWASKGFLAIDMNAHGIPNGKPAAFYKELETGKLKGYPHFGKESRETVYFLGMFLRVFRAIDFMAAQPEWDGKTIVAYGSSQGAFQSFAAALDERVSFIAAGVPAGCDHTGFKAGRVSGWPKLVPLVDGTPDPAITEVARYFDNVNFAAHTKAKAAFLTVGFIDTTCPPSTVYATYNRLPIRKEIFDDLPTAHANSPEATAARLQAVLDYVKSVQK
jgi:cephalosporin-C deacetylase